MSSPESRAAWARLSTKVYEADPLVCGRCGSPMRVVAVITEPQQVRKILRHLIKTGKAPPGLDPASVRSAHLAIPYGRLPNSILNPPRGATANRDAARTDYGRTGRAFRAIMRTIVKP